MVAAEHPGVRRSRLVWNLPVRLHEGDHPFEAALFDISLSGARVSRPGGWRGLQPQPVLLELADEGGRTLHLPVRVVREGGNELALSFEHLGRGEEAALNELLARRGTLSDGID